MATCDQGIGCCLNDCITVAATVINTIPTLYHNRCEATAIGEGIGEGIVDDVGYGVGDGYRGQAAATRESRRTDASYGIGNPVIGYTAGDG